jgi:hypothetical protein
LEGKSYRVIAREVYARSGRKISPTSLSHLVYDVAVRCKSPWDLSRELKPRWEGFLVLDEKMVPVRGKRQWFYGAFDTSGDVVHWRAVREMTVNEAVIFLQEVKVLGYRCRGVVTDVDAVLTRAVELEYGESPHQYCLKHALASIESLLGYKSLVLRQRRTQGQLRQGFEQLRERARGCIFGGHTGRSWSNGRQAGRSHGMLGRSEICVTDATVCSSPGQRHQPELDSKTFGASVRCS